MRLIDLDELVILGPGSEWFWFMCQFLALAVTGLAILRQLRAQRSASLYDQMAAWNREFNDPLMVRSKLGLMRDLEHRDPGAGVPQVNDEVPDFFERVGYLVSRGHLRAEDFWNDARPVVAFYWGILEPYVMAGRASSGDLGHYRWFEWLEAEMRQLDARRGRPTPAFDPGLRASAIAARIAIFEGKLRRDGREWSDELGTPATISIRHQADSSE